MIGDRRGFVESNRSPLAHIPQEYWRRMGIEQRQSLWSTAHCVQSLDEMAREFAQKQKHVPSK